MSVNLVSVLGRPAVIRTVGCMICLAALAEMALDNQGARSARPVAMTKAEIKFKEFG